MSQPEFLFPEFEASREPVHDWYQFVLGYEARLVRDLLDELAPKSRLAVLDPFCGTGTTLVEARKRGHRTAGLDANPVATFMTSATFASEILPRPRRPRNTPFRRSVRASNMMVRFLVGYPHAVKAAAISRVLCFDHSFWKIPWTESEPRP